MALPSLKHYELMVTQNMKTFNINFIGGLLDDNHTHFAKTKNTIGRHIFRIKIFKDFEDIYPALKIFILENFCSTLEVF